ncbi:hypothetical protein ISCGN_031079 [Ixodes scapularis]
MGGWMVESLGAEKEDTDPEEAASSSDLGPLSSMGSSCVADGRPWGVDCRDGSPGLFGPEDTRLREAGVEAVYCLARGAPKGPNIPRAQLNHQGPLFPGHGYATHSQTWVGEPTWLGVRSDATHQAPTKVGAPCVRVWWPTWLGSVVTLLTKHLAPKVQAPPAGLGADRPADDDVDRITGRRGGGGCSSGAGKGDGMATSTDDVEERRQGDAAAAAVATLRPQTTASLWKLFFSAIFGGPRAAAQTGWAAAATSEGGRGGGAPEMGRGRNARGKEPPARPPPHSARSTSPSARCVSSPLLMRGAGSLSAREMAPRSRV